MRRRPVVAIDGPAGAGKTTVTRRVAATLGYTLVDTGALYRAVALVAAEARIGWDNPGAVGALAHELAERHAIRFEGEPSAQRVLLDGRDVGDAIRTQQIAEGASKVSAYGEVRTALLELQRAAGRQGGVVLEGRDIGTVVFPDAEAKFFLTASTEVRARRRFDELRGRGIDADFEQVHGEVVVRDRRDSERAVAPLMQAKDAVLVDSSGLSIDEVVVRIVSHVRDIERQMLAGDEP